MMGGSPSEAVWEALSLADWTEYSCCCGEADRQNVEGRVMRNLFFISGSLKLLSNRFAFCSFFLLDTYSPFALQSNFRMLFIVKYKVPYGNPSPQKDTSLKFMCGFRAIPVLEHCIQF